MNKALRELLDRDVLYVVKDKAEFVLFKKCVEDDATRVAHISNVDELITEMEKISGNETFVFSDKLPDDVGVAILDIAQIVDNLPENLLKIVEIGGRFFKNSLRLSADEKTSWMVPVVEDVKKPVEDVLKKPVEASYWGDLSDNKKEDKELERLRKDLDELVTQKMEVENELIKLSESVKVRGEKSDVELARVTSLYEDREQRLTEELDVVRKSLSEYQVRYAERSNEYEDLLLTMKSLRSELEVKTSLIENDLSTREEELTEQLEELQKELLDREITIKNKNVTLERIELELRKLRDSLSSAELEVTAQRELFSESRFKVEGLENTIENLREEILVRDNELKEILRTYTSPEESNEYKETLEKRDLTISDFNEQLKKLRVETLKEAEKRVFAEDELDRLRASYREMLGNSNSTKLAVDEKTLGSEVMTNVYYFKVISQPLYFKSFMTNFVELLTKDRGSVLTILIREDDEFTDMYFEGIRRVRTLDEVVTSDKVVILKPSQIMFSESDSFYNAYDSIVVVDFLKTRERYLNTPNGLVVTAFINEKEVDMHGVRGLVLTSGENSIIPMQYNKEIELAKTPLVKKMYVQSVVRSWMKRLSLIK